MKFYEVNVLSDDGSTYFLTESEALAHAKRAENSTGWGSITVDCITIGRPTQKLILNILNGHGYVKGRERVFKREEDLTYEEK